MCRHLVGEFQGVADVLPFTLDEETPTPELKARILSEAAAEVPQGENNAAIISLERERERLEGRDAFHRRSLRLMMGAVAALLIVVVGLVAWNIILQVDASDGLTAEQQQFLNAIASGAELHNIPGTDAAPNAAARLVFDPVSGRVLLLAQNMPRLQSSQVFQAWRIEGEAPIGAGTFVAPRDPEQPIALLADFSRADAIGISIEPAGGSDSPTGDIVLLGALLQ